MTVANGSNTKGYSMTRTTCGSKAVHTDAISDTEENRLVEITAAQVFEELRPIPDPIR